VARLAVDEWLRERRPAPDLAERLVCVWRGDLGTAALPLPDERLDLVWVDDGSLWLSGPETSSWSRGYPPGTGAVGVGFRPGVGPPMLGLAASEVRDARVRVGELWGDRDARELTELVAAQPDDRGRARELERAVRRLAGRARPVDDVALRVAARLNQPGAASVRDLSRATGLSQRQLHRRCAAAFGYGPAVLARMLRLQRALRLARSDQGPLRLAELATDAGYFDQQHLAHEVRAIMGTTPTKLLRCADVRSVQDTARLGRG
jgi:AraC-like DNA-binding protein